MPISLKTLLLSGLILVGFASQTSVWAQESTDSQSTADEWADWGDFEEPEEASPFTWAGFVELAAGARLNNDTAVARNTTLQDARVQLQADYALSASTLSLRGDLYYDGKDEVSAFLRCLA